MWGYVSFLVVAGNNSQNENMFVQKNRIGLLNYDLIADMCIYKSKHSFILYLSILNISLVRTDSQVDIQIRILLKDKYRNCVKNANTGNHTLIS